MKPRYHGSTRFYGAVVTVRDLDRCRVFYADVLGLGQPVVDSNFWVEFEVVPDQMVLALKKQGATALGESMKRTTDRTATVAWCLQVDALKDVQARLIHHECYPQAASILPNGMEALTFHDPEGNPFIILGHTVAME